MLASGTGSVEEPTLLAALLDLLAAALGGSRLRHFECVGLVNLYGERCQNFCPAMRRNGCVVVVGALCWHAIADKQAQRAVVGWVATVAPGSSGDGQEGALESSGATARGARALPL